MRVLLTGLLMFVSSLSLAQGLTTSGDNPFGGPAAPAFLPVDEAYHLDADMEGADQLRLHWQIADGYYLYQHRFQFSFAGDNGPVALEAELPPALQRSDEFFGDVGVYYTSVDITLNPATPLGRGTLTVSYQGCADAGLCYPPEKKYLAVDIGAGTITMAAPPARPNPSPATDNSGGTGTLLTMLVLAFLGGSILNLMPCVFPVLSLKVLAFARNTSHDRHLHSWVYTAGVIFSFIAIAATLIVLQQAGRAVGWGFQLQSPGFVIALAYLFVAMGLSLSGLIEFGGSVMNTGSALADRGGLRGSFFTGVLAVVVASPCTAPFMGTALGFALTQPAYVALLVFAALGAGMAAPLLLFGYSGAARRFMPRPGPWMETLKQLLAFPLYATALWLFWVAGRQTGVNTMTLALGGALALALGLWLWRFGGWQRGLAVAALLLALGMGAWHPSDNGHTQPESKRAEWSDQLVQELRTSGRPVFVDVTADWCLTCIANERTVLLTDDVAADFARQNVAYVVADWTNYDPRIAELLERHGRTGIPLYLLYPADSSREPLILPQILTRSAVLEALQQLPPQVAQLAD